VTDLTALVAEELAVPVDARVSAMAKAIAKKHGKASRAVLFYGSCLREKRLEGLMLDFYLIVSDYRAAYGKGWLAVANRLIPPNVFYFEHDRLAAKYAVLSEADFAHECSPDAWTVSTAARFAQPSRLVWSAHKSAAKRIISIVAAAAPTLLDWTLPTGTETANFNDLWKAAFARTFDAELRAERVDRSSSIVETDPERYDRLALAALHAIALKHGVGPAGEVPLIRSANQAASWWRRKRVKGKFYSIARLAKASLTFAGGPDYIAWKINRHAGTEIELKPWQRRHPLLAAVSLLPRLLKSGAVR
jgi:hypothetical protein